MLKKASALFNAFNSFGLSYCHWKSNEHLIAGLCGDTDLDVLIDPMQKEQAILLLQQLEYVKVSPQFGARYRDVEDWIGEDHDTGKLIHVHLHYRMITGHKGLKEYELPWRELGLCTRILDHDSNVYITDPNLEIFILLTRIGLKMKPLSIIKSKCNKYKIGEDDEREICYLVNRIERDKVVSIAEHFYDKPDEISNLIFTESRDERWISKVHSISKINFRQCCEYSFADLYLRRLFYRVTMSLNSRLKKFFSLSIINKKTIPSSGLIVAIIGQDGAGKSTVTKDIIKWLRWKIEAQRCYLGSGEYYHSVEKSLRRFFSRKNGKIFKYIAGYYTLKDNLKLSKRTVSVLAKADRYRSNGGIAIFDRYPQIKYHGINDGPKIVSFIEKYLLPHIVKKFALTLAEKEERNLRDAVSIEPDVVIKLMLSPEESIRRKPTESFEMVSRKHNIIKNLEFEGASVFVVDASLPYKVELMEIQNILWKEILMKRNASEDYSK